MNTVKTSDRSIIIKQDDGYKTKLIHMLSPTPPKGCILILHGMAEHHKRYQSFAEYLLDEGYDVYLYDHRGHGTETSLNELGFISLEHGYQALVNDGLKIIKYIEDNKRSKKFILFGHSMGSLVARNILQHYDNFAGVILCGSTHPNSFTTSIGKTIASIVTKNQGPKKKSPFLNNILFGSKKYTHFADRTSFDWLTRSNGIVGNYVHDPYCGFICTTSFYLDLISLTSIAIRKKNMAYTRKDLPHLIISGKEDPVGTFGKEIKNLSNLYHKLGFQSIDTKLYDNCRHELLNELNADDIYSDIHHWISKL